MRRRLWWHLWAKDARASEDHGITVTNVDPSSDIDFPLNIDDSEIDPSLRELPAAKPKWSEMTFSLIVMETNHALQRLYHMVMSSLNHLPWESSRKETMDCLTAHIKDYLKNCNPNVPIQRATLLFTRLILRKLDFVSHQQWLNRSDPGPKKRESHATEENIVNACEILELNLQIQSDDLLRGYRWAFETYPQYHILLYVLWHLCVKPVGPSVDRAWAAVDGSFEHENANQRDVIAGPGSKWAVLKMLREKAMHIRQTVNYSDPRRDSHVERVDAPNLEYSAEAFDGMGNGTLEDAMNWGPDAAALPDWSMLVDDFHTQPYTFG